ncbi:hypothetical protein [Mycolicibacterium canariasense]|uniref:hypothetical protein n=1 Tax=Mycolicibacterium canariasense TaxID=228230 RepID=UPI0032D586B3
MGYYKVVRPCVVGKLHYATVPSQPVEVDDEVAGPLVVSGDLDPYQPGESLLDEVLDSVPETDEVQVVAVTGVEAADPVVRRGRRKAED